MADDSANIYPYPLQFDPSQWSNKYSQYYGMPLPFMGQMAGAPTDAHGNPIQSYTDAQTAHDAWNAANPAPAVAQGTTLNSAPQQQLQRTYLGQGTGGAAGGQNAMGSGGPTAGQSAYGYTMAPQQGMAAQSQSQAPAAAPQNPVNMSQAYLNALANPGKVTTPGATVPQANLPSNQSGVLQQFLANWQNSGGNTKGAGNYDNSGFYKALQGSV